MHTKSNYQINNNKIVIFGAGKIGRSFIGQLFSRSGYEVVFIDVNNQLINALNRKGSYNVIIKSDKSEEVITIANIRGVELGERETVLNEIATAGVVALSVGQQGLPAALPLISDALLKRCAWFGESPLDFIICENMRNADQYIFSELGKHLPAGYPLSKLAGLVETSIGKMVPIMTKKDLDEDPLQVFAEQYNTLIVSRQGFRNPIPLVMNLEPKDNMKAWVDRKLFIHNLGHVTSAYLGYQRHPNTVFIYEVLDNPEILALTRQTMLQSAELLIDMYPEEFSIDQLTLHIDDLLKRFRNRALGDTVFRVGCDLYRKLGPEDRLVAPIRAALKLHKPYDLIISALKAALNFNATDENGQFFSSDKSFFREAESGLNHILVSVCHLDPSELNLT